MPTDIKAIIKIIKRSFTKDLELSTHESIVNTAVYNKAISDVVTLLEGIESGRIDSKSLKQMTED